MIMFLPYFMEVKAQVIIKQTLHSDVSKSIE